MEQSFCFEENFENTKTKKKTQKNSEWKKFIRKEDGSRHYCHGWLHCEYIYVTESAWKLKLNENENKNRSIAQFFLDFHMLLRKKRGLWFLF